MVDNLPCFYAASHSVSFIKTRGWNDRITTVLKESEAIAVRKAACSSGAECIVITPVPYWMRGVNMEDTYSNQRMAEPGQPV
jgi:hypothetical protein